MASSEVGSNVKKRKTALIAGGIALVVIMLIAVAWRVWLRGTFSSREPVSVERVSVISSRSNGITARYAGVVGAEQSAEYARDGRGISECYVVVGQQVVAGTELFTYDSSEESAELERLRLEKERIENTMQSIRDRLGVLNAAYENVSSTVQLQYSLQIQGFEAQLSQLEYDLGATTIELEAARAAVAACAVYAPFDGTVLSIDEEGETYMCFGGGEGRSVLCYVGEQAISNVIVGDKFIVRSRTEDVAWSGVVSSIGGAVADGGESRFPVTVTVSRADGLMIGQHVYIEPDLGDRAEGVWLTYCYILTNGEYDYVWAVNPASDTLEIRVVELGEYDGATMSYQIVSGLSADDEIAWPDNSYRAGDPVTRTGFVERSSEYILVGEGEEDEEIEAEENNPAASNALAPEAEDAISNLIPSESIVTQNSGVSFPEGDTHGRSDGSEVG